MSDHECGACGRAIAAGGCECDATWPTGRRSYGWIVVGLLLAPVSAGSAFGAWWLAERVVFERPHLGFEAVASGAVLIGTAALLSLAGPAAFVHGLGLLRDRHRARLTRDPSTWRRFCEGIDAGHSRLVAVGDRTPDALARGLVAVGVVLWAVAFTAAGSLPRPVFVAVTLFAWAAVPIGILAEDAHTLADRSIAALSLVPFGAALVGAGYLIARSTGW